MTRGPPTGSRGYPKMVLLEEILLGDKLGSYGFGRTAQNTCPVMRKKIKNNIIDFAPVGDWSYLQ